jgi:Virulence factor
MATYRIMRWQEIPSAVEVRDDNGVSKQQLSNRFQVLIDHAAMRRGLADSDAYMDQWCMSEAETRPGSAAEILAQVTTEIEEAFPQFRDNVNKLPRS